jgi:hypothetical protein
MEQRVSRRTVLRSGVGVAAAAVAGATVVGLVDVFSGNSKRLTADQAILKDAGRPAATELTRSHFSPHLQSTFDMSRSRRGAKVVLSEINDLHGPTAPNDEHRFSLLFSAPQQFTEGQAIYEFANPNFGRMALFAAPVDRGVVGRHYEVIVNKRP